MYSLLLEIIPFFIFYGALYESEKANKGNCLENPSYLILEEMITSHDTVDISQMRSKYTNIFTKEKSTIYKERVMDTY